MWPPKNHLLEKSGVMRDSREDMGIVERPCHLPHSIMQWHSQISFLWPEVAHRETIE